MKVSQSLRLSLAVAAFSFVLPLGIAQTAKQDMKDAGSDTKHAATSAGHGISHGTKTAYHKTVHGRRRGTTRRPMPRRLVFTRLRESPIRRLIILRSSRCGRLILPLKPLLG